MSVPPSRENYLRPFNSLFFSPFSVLLNKWEKLLVKIGANIQHTEVYESLKNDIVSLRLDLTKVLEDKEEAEDDTEDDIELEHKLHTFRVSEYFMM